MMEHISLIRYTKHEQLNRNNLNESYKGILCLSLYLLRDKPIQGKCYDNVLPC